LRDFCNFDVERLSKENITGELTRFDGSKLVLPQDLLGKNIIFQFWSLAHPPKPFKSSYIRGGYPIGNDPPDLLSPLPDKHTVIVGVNLDTDPKAVAAFVEQHREYADWIHTYSGKGWDDPVARALGVYPLPRIVAMNYRGQVECYGGRSYDRLFETVQFSFGPPRLPNR
jgi:hypothetical protein